MKKIIFFISMLILFSMPCYAHDWKAMANDLVKDYQGKIISIEQLNSSTCWAVLSFRVSNLKAVEIAENIGYYIRNTTGGIKGEKPSVHVFVGGKRIAIARPSGTKYSGTLKIEDWGTAEFKGKYKP